MSEQKNTSVFRQKNLDRISSPEQLTGYLRVTTPGIWTVLAAAIVLLAGVFAWAAVGTLETTVRVTAMVENHVAQVIPIDTEVLSAGMPLRAAGQEVMLASTAADAYGRSYGTAVIDLPDGAYDGVVVTETVHPIQFLLAGN